MTDSRRFSGQHHVTVVHCYQHIRRITGGRFIGFEKSILRVRANRQEKYSCQQVV
jgi:hypothetical protein